MISNKKQKTRTLLAAIVVTTGTILSLFVLNLVLGSSQPNLDQATRTAINVPVVAAKAVAPSAHVYGLPVRLTIPKINVDSNIQNMGLTSSGNLEAPTTNTDAGWYKYGSRPGNKGNAVIDGHFGLGNIKAIFSQLGTLQKGDEITVTDDLGKVSSFVVRTSKLYDQDTQPAEVFNSTTGSHLNLITCDGVWEPGKQTYTKRLVVFADKV